jgi:hypothetical protein
LYNRAVGNLLEIREKALPTFSSESQEMKDKIRIERAVPLAILVSLHNRMDDLRIRYQQNNYKKLSDLFNKLEKSLEEFSPFG